MASPGRVVITGMGVVAPNGIGIDPFWDSLLNCRSGIGPVTMFDAADLPCRIAGEVKGFEPHEYIDPKLKPGKRMGRGAQFGVAAVSMALADAGLDPADLQNERDLPVIIGVSSSAMDIAEQPPRPWSGFAIIPHATASAIAFTLGFQARLITISDGCASGLDAVAVAAREIRRGKSEIAITGSAESMMTRYVFECFATLKALSARNDEPEKASRPFDRDRDGGLIAEGAGMLILENLEHALARGARVYGEVLGYGSCGDSPDDVEGAGLERAMELALANAGCRKEEIDHVSAHGPSDQHMDRLETQLIKNVFGRDAYRIPVTSIKGVTGNPMAVGSVLQLIAAALSVTEETLVPTANLENADPACDLDYVPRSPRTVKIEKVLVNTHGFGRGNSALVLKRV